MPSKRVLLETENGERVEFNSINDVGSYLKIPPKRVSYYISTGRMYLGYYFKNINNTVNHKYFQTWSENMAYILGFYVADGSMKIEEYRPGKFRYYFRISSIDKDVIEFIKEEMNATQNIQIYKSKKENVKDRYTLEIGSKHIVQSLINIGINEEKTLGDPIVRVPEEYKSDFWRGYIDGDGCISNDRNSVRIETIFTEFNKFLINEFKVFLDARDICYREYITKHKQLGTIYLHTIHVQKDFSKLVNELHYERFSMERKKRRVYEKVSNWDRC